MTRRLRERLADRALEDGFLGLDAELCLQRISITGRLDERRFQMLVDGPLGGLGGLTPRHHR